MDTELYLHDNQEEIGSFYPDGRAKHLRILGIGKETVAVELDGKPFACITDIHRNIERLIDAHAKIANHYQYSAFGETLLSEETVFNPWRYTGKRFDPDLQLFSFGKRFYDPELIRWLTPDPAGFTDSYNLYQYVLTNPFRYYDPDGTHAAALNWTFLGVPAAGLTIAALSNPVGWVCIGAAVLTGLLVYKAPDIRDAIDRWTAYRENNDIQGNVAVQQDQKNSCPFQDPEDEEQEKKSGQERD